MGFYLPGLVRYAGMLFPSSLVCLRVHLGVPSPTQTLSFILLLSLSQTFPENNGVYHKPGARVHLERPNIGTLAVILFSSLSSKRSEGQCGGGESEQGSGPCLALSGQAEAGLASAAANSLDRSSPCWLLIPFSVYLLRSPGSRHGL